MIISLESVAAPAIALNEDEVVVGANERALEALGMDRDAVVGRPLPALVDGREQPHSRDPDETAEWQIDGRTYLRLAGDRVGDLRTVILVDVSGLVDERDRARDLAQARSEFLGKLSHEIRSAVASMVGFADMFEAEATDESRDRAGIITRSGRHLIDTLNAVMDLAQIEFGEKEVELADVDVVARTRDRVIILQADAERKGLDLTFRPHASSVRAHLNPVFLDRILHNLIDNAIKYTDEGRIEVEVERRDGRAWIYVADTGRGMDATFVPRLFAPFERERRGDDGAGLGLAVTRYLVELMDGRIFACSTAGEGSTFTVSFPIPSGG